jgi:hypothetical protein
MSKYEIFKSELVEREVLAFRMVTGEEVIAQLSSSTESYVEIKQPRVLVAQLRRQADGSPIMAANILNWLNSDPDASAKVSYDDIISITKCEPGMETEYVRFTTGIQLVTKDTKIIV